MPAGRGGRLPVSTEVRGGYTGGFRMSAGPRAWAGGSKRTQPSRIGFFETENGECGPTDGWTMTQPWIEGRFEDSAITTRSSRRSIGPGKGACGR